jgi:hypothetical protein
MLEITRKDWIYVRNKLLNMCKEKLEKIEYMSEKTIFTNFFLHISNLF